MWVYHVAPFLCLKALFMMLFIRDLSKSCGMEVDRVETLMWVYHVAPFLCLKALFMMLFIRDLSKSCGMEVDRVEKSNV